MPSNEGYMYAAYVVTAVIFVLYGLSITVRRRALRNRKDEP
jgi:hypothetical protein